MHPYCIYVFDSSTANEAAIAVKGGQYESIIQYHSIKHQHKKPSLHLSQKEGAPPTPHMMGGQPPLLASQSHHQGLPPPPVPTTVQLRPPSPMHQQQPYDPNLSSEKMKERETKLERLGLLAQMTTQPPPPTMHQMTSFNPQDLPPSQQQLLQQIPHHQLALQSQHQQPFHQRQHQQQLSHIKQEHQEQQLQSQLDPLSSMAALSECPNMDSYGHTIHHHPPG